MANAQLQPAAPSTVFGTVATPRRKPNAELRPREYLTEAEVERLRRAACAGNRNGHRDETMILIAFRRSSAASCSAVRNSERIGSELDMATSYALLRAYWGIADIDRHGR